MVLVAAWKKLNSYLKILEIIMVGMICLILVLSYISIDIKTAILPLITIFTVSLLLLTYFVYYFGKDKLKAGDVTFVNMGLSVYWATANVSNGVILEDVSNHYSWGGLNYKSFYGIKTCATYDKKFNDIAGDINYDVVSSELGGETTQTKQALRMPTKSELEELINSCNWELVKNNGMLGYKVTSKINDNFIFLPLKGFYDEDTLIGDSTIGAYWSSTPNENDTKESYALYIEKGVPSIISISRHCGLLVRPVYKAPIFM